MKKWTYYVAPVALSLAMLTGCIENDEPAGISDLRGAKAEFIRAKTQFELASVEIQKVKIDREKAALAYDNVLLKLKEMDVELKQIDIDLKNITLEAEREKLENTKAQLLAGREAMLGNHAITMTQIKENAARAEASYQQALVDIQLATILYKDEQFTEEIDGLTGQLEGTREMLNGANDDLFAANSALADYVVEAAYYEKKLNANIDKQKALIASKTELLGQLEAIEPVSVEDWTAQIKDIEAELIAIDKEASDLKLKINEKRTTIAPVNNQIALQNELLRKADKSYAFPLADADLQNDLYTYFRDAGSLDPTTSFEYIPGSNGEYKMVSELKVENFALNDLDYRPIKYVVNRIKAGFTTDFRDAYATLFGEYLDYDNNNQWYIITEAAMAKAKAEIAKMDLYTAEKKKEYAADEKAWADAYIAYFDALKAYGYNPKLHNGYMGYEAAEKTVYETAQAALEAYNKIEGTPAAAQRTALKATLKDYYTKRKALDGTTYTRLVSGENVDFYTLFEDADEMPDATFDHIVIANAGEGNDIQTLLGSPVVSMASNSDNKGAISVLIAASDAAFGTGSDFKAIVVPAFENNVISKETLVLPVGIPVNAGSSYEAYLNAYKNLKAFINIDKWNAYSDGLYAAYTALSDQKDAVDKEIADLNSSVADVNEEIYEMEYALSKLVFDYDYWTPGNWYPRLNSYETKTAVLSGLKSQLERTVTGTLNNQALIKVLVYEDGYWQYKYLSVPDAITELKETIAGLEEDLADEENKLAQYKANGEVRDDLGNKEYRATLETEIANCKKTVAMYEDRMTALNATLQALLNAYAGK